MTIDLQPFKVIPQNTNVRTGTTRHMFEGPHGGWAYAYVDDHSGILVIVSDWDTWSYRWHASPQALGVPTLTHFLAKCRTDSEYIGRKLTHEHGPRSGDGKPARVKFDHDATVKAFQKLLCANRLIAGRETWDAGSRPRHHDDRQRLDRLSKEMARSLWNELDGFEDGDHIRFMDQFWALDEHTLIDDSGEAYENCVYAPTNAYMVLTKCILPALITSCIATVAARELVEAFTTREAFIP